MLEFDRFKYCMNLLKEELEKDRRINEVFYKEGLLERGYPLDLVNGRLIDVYVDLLENSMEDDENWINWFIWENDWGKKNLVCMYKDEKVPLNTLKQLYNFLVKMNRDKKCLK